MLEQVFSDGQPGDEAAGSHRLTFARLWSWLVEFIENTLAIGDDAANEINELLAGEIEPDERTLVAVQLTELVTYFEYAAQLVSSMDGLLADTQTGLRARSPHEATVGLVQRLRVLAPGS